MIGATAIKNLPGPKWTTRADREPVATRMWAGCTTVVETYGNCLAAVASMYGIAVEELISAALDIVDPRYPVPVTIRCRVAI